MNPCAYCGSNSFRPLLSGVTDRLAQSAKTYAFAACNGCGSSWLDPAPSEKELKEAYPEVYGLGSGETAAKPLARFLQSLELALWFRPVYRRNVRVLSRYHGPTGNLLDIGCGSGHQTACFKEAGYDVTALDFAPNVAQRMRALHDIEAHECSVSELGQALSGKSFDVITAFHVVEHTLNPDEFLRDIKGLLRPGGTIFFSAPLAGSVQARLFGRSWGAYREAPRHVSVPSRKGLSMLFERHSLRDIIVKTDHPLYLAGSALPSLLSSLTMTSSYGGSSVVAAVKRFIGAGLAFCYLPAACLEAAGRSYSMGLILGRCGRSGE